MADETVAMSDAPTLELSRAVMHPVRGHHAFESCVEQLAAAIRLGIYPPGSGLPPERDLAVQMRVSRTTLREAIAALRAADLVETRRGRGGGTVVRYRPDAPARVGTADLTGRSADLLDTLVFRRVVEPGAAHLAASGSLTGEQRAYLEQAHAAVAEATDPGTHRQADSRFHLLVAAVTESPLLSRAVAEVQTDLHEMLTAIPVLEVNIEHSTRQHRAIVKAILDGDATRARRAMEQHCDDTAALLRGLLG